MKIKNTIKLEQAQAGQILATDVNDLYGNCLMAKGVVLNEKAISSLLVRGVETLIVWGQTLTDDDITNRQKVLKERLAHRFRKVENEPEMCQLHDILLSHQLESFEPEAGDI